MEELAQLGDPAATKGRVILAHLGNGASFTAVCDGECLDTLVFPGGIGKKSPQVRTRIYQGRDFLGIDLDEKRNAISAAVISEESSRATVRVINTDEELMIARPVCPGAEARRNELRDWALTGRSSPHGMLVVSSSG